MALTIIFTIFGFCLGWLISDLGYIEGKELKGGIKKNLKKYLKPVNQKFLFLYSAVGLVSALVIGCEYNSIYGWLIILVAAILLHASVVDIISFQINSPPVIYPLLALLLSNIILWVFNINVNTQFEPTDKLLAGSIAAIIFFFIITITKKKGMGEGDLFIFILMALTLGVLKMIVSFYVMVIVGSIYGIILGLRYKKFRGIKVPFVPFMTLGFIVAALFGDIIINFYITNILVI